MHMENGCNCLELNSNSLNWLIAKGLTRRGLMSRRIMHLCVKFIWIHHPFHSTNCDYQSTINNDLNLIIFYWHRNSNVKKLMIFRIHEHNPLNWNALKQWNNDRKNMTSHYLLASKFHLIVIRWPYLPENTIITIHSHWNIIFS